MKKLILIFAIAVSNISNAQTVTLDFSFYTQFKYTGTQIDTNILNLDGFKYTAIGFGKNHVVLDAKAKSLINEYYVNEDFFGTLTYTNMSNYKKSNGVTKFQAQRVDYATGNMYTEYFIINENSDTNSPYIISYWKVGDEFNGVIVPRSAIQIN
jgi:hypothetical protein